MKKFSVIRINTLIKRVRRYMKRHHVLVQEFDFYGVNVGYHNYYLVFEDIAIMFNWADDANQITVHKHVISNVAFEKKVLKIDFYKELDDPKSVRYFYKKKKK